LPFGGTFASFPTDSSLPDGPAGGGLRIRLSRSLVLNEPKVASLPPLLLLVAAPEIFTSFDVDFAVVFEDFADIV